MTDLNVALVIRAAADKSVAKALGTTQKEIGKTATASVNAGSTTERAAQGSAKAIDRQAKKTVELGATTKRAAGDAAKALDRQNSALGRTVRETTALGRTTRAAADSTRRLTRETREQSSVLGRTARQLREVSRRQREVNQEQQRGRGLGNSLGVAAGTAVSGAGIAAGVRTSFSASFDAEAARTRLETAINSRDPKKAMTEAIEFARSQAQSGTLDEVALLDIQYALNSAGLDAAAAIVGTRVVEKVARATGGLPEETAEVISGVLLNLAKDIEGTDEERFNRVGDILAKTQIVFKLKDFNQLGESFKMGASSAARFNVPLEQTAILLGQLNTSDLKGSMAGTALSATLRQLTTANKELDFGIVRGPDGKLDVFQTLSQLKGKLDEIDDIDERNDVMQDLFGDEGARGLQPLLDNLDTMIEKQKEYVDLVGFTDSKYKLFLDDTGQLGDKFRRNLVQLGAAIAASFSPILNPAFEAGAKGLAKVTNFVTDNNDGWGMALGTVGALAAGYGGIKLGGAVLGKVLGRGKGGGGLGGGMATAARTIGGKGVIPVYVVNMGAGGMGGFGGKGAKGAGGKAGWFSRMGSKIGGAGKLGGALKVGGTVLGKAAMPVALGLTAIDGVSSAIEGDTKGVGSAVGTAGGMLAGAAAGAAIGSIVPIIGTTIGALVGGVAGAYLGGEAGEWAGGWFEDDDAKGPAGETTREGDTFNIKIDVAATSAESPEELGRRIARQIEQERRQAQREGLYDGE